MTVKVTLSMIFHELDQGEPTSRKQPWELYAGGINIIKILEVWTGIVPKAVMIPDIYCSAPKLKTIDFKLELEYSPATKDS
ncbi:hypothetical protein BB560_004670 [Smittium megazygosporum]|uniref:Uncharacterized protein n=1 Tax=Smittium megazygosporum TaxID=133381 RepID=A0A2T9Z8M4_9FUNG|nr:hypothetical protein BB560_004670 [Smittium megazygosporum]